MSQYNNNSIALVREYTRQYTEGTSWFNGKRVTINEKEMQE